MRLAAVLFAIFAIACGETATEPTTPVDVEGVWTQVAGPDALTTDLDLVQDSVGSLTGCFVRSNDGGYRRVVPVSGTVEGGAVSFSATWQQSQYTMTWRFDGRLDGSTLAGVANGTTWSDTPISFTRRTESESLCDG